jgi:hypothetical protein
MNKYQKAFNTITNTLICYMIRRDLYPLPSDDEIYNAQMVLSKLVDKADSFEWIPFTFDEEGILNCELPDIGERILVSDTKAMYDDESIWIDSWDSPDCGIYELESGEDLKGLAWMSLPNPYKGNQNETNC